MPKQNRYAQKKKTSFEICNIEKQTNSFNSFKKEFMKTRYHTKSNKENNEHVIFPYRKKIKNKFHWLKPKCVPSKKND